MTDNFSIPLASNSRSYSFSDFSRFDLVGSADNPVIDKDDVTVMLERGQNNKLDKLIKAAEAKDPSIAAKIRAFAAEYRAKKNIPSKYNGSHVSHKTLTTAFLSQKFLIPEEVAPGYNIITSRNLLEMGGIPDTELLLKSNQLSDRAYLFSYMRAEEENITSNDLAYNFWPFPQTEDEARSAIDKTNALIKAAEAQGYSIEAQAMREDLLDIISFYINSGEQGDRSIYSDRRGKPFNPEEVKRLLSLIEVSGDAQTRALLYKSPVLSPFLTAKN